MVDSPDRICSVGGNPLVGHQLETYRADTDSLNWSSDLLDRWHACCGLALCPNLSVRKERLPREPELVAMGYKLESLPFQLSGGGRSQDRPSGSGFDILEFNVVVWFEREGLILDDRAVGDPRANGNCI